MKRLIFKGLIKIVSDEVLEEHIFNIDFYGQLMVKFSNDNNNIIPINAMNGGGYNCFHEIKDQKVIIEDI